MLLYKIDLKSFFAMPFLHQNDTRMVFRPNGPRREKTCLRGVRQSEFQNSLLSYRD